MTIEKLYKLSEVSDILGVSKNCLHTWAMYNKIEIVNIAPEWHKRALRVKSSELERLTNKL